LEMIFPNPPGKHVFPIGYKWMLSPINFLISLQKQLPPMDKTYKVSVNGTFDFEFTNEDIDSLDAIKLSKSTYHILQNSKSFKGEIASKDFHRKSYSININSNQYAIQISDELDKLIENMGLSVSISKAINDIKAPMPGMILDV